MGADSVINLDRDEGGHVEGRFRFDGEFALAVDPIGGARIDVEPLPTDTVPMDEAAHAFEVAGDKMRSMKVPLAF